MVDSLSARKPRVALGAQGLRGARSTSGGVAGMLRRLGAVQLDTISVLARSHELVAYARREPSAAPASSAPTGARRAPPSNTGPTPRAWCRWRTGPPTRSRRARGGQGQALARTGGAGQELPGRCWPACAPTAPSPPTSWAGPRRVAPGGTGPRPRSPPSGCSTSARSSAASAAASPRVYDLAERAVPAELLAQEWTDEECAPGLVAAAGRSLGVATEADLAVYHGVPRRSCARSCRRPSWSR